MQLVVGEGGVDLPGLGVQLYVLAAVHRGADGGLCLRILERRGIYGAHQDLGLALVAVVPEDGVVLEVEGYSPPVGEVCDVERPAGEQIEVRFTVVGVVGAGGDELVDAPVFLVVPGVDDDLPGIGDVYGGVLVPDAPEPGVLGGWVLSGPSSQG